MSTIPPQMRPTIDRFAEGMGLVASPQRDGSVSFVFERSGRLTFTPADDGERVVMSLTRPSQRAPQDILSRAGYEPVLDLVVSAGMTRTGAAVFAIAFDEERFELSDIDRGFRHLLAAFEG